MKHLMVKIRNIKLVLREKLEIKLQQSNEGFRFMVSDEEDHRLQAE